MDPPAHVPPGLQTRSVTGMMVDRNSSPNDSAMSTLIQLGSRLPRSSTWTKRVLLIILSAILTLALTEQFLRAVGPDTHYIGRPNTVRELMPESTYVPGVSGRVHFRVNEWGLRGDPVPTADAQYILVLGGSTAECLLLDHDETWPALIQHRLRQARPNENTWVANGGVSGHGSREHVHQLTQLLKERPAFQTVLILVGINDLLVRLVHGEVESPPPEGSIERAFIMQPSFEPTMPPYKRTMLWRHARNLKNRLKKWHRQGPTGIAYVRWRAHRKNCGRILSALPDLRAALAGYRARLHALIDVAHMHETRIVFLTQPVMWSAALPDRLQDLLWAGGVGDYQRGRATAYYSPAALAEGMRQFNDTLRHVCASRRVECIDLAATLPRDDSVFYDDCHFNENGARLLAAIVADTLLERTDQGSSLPD